MTSILGKRTRSSDSGTLSLPYAQWISANLSRPASKPLSRVKRQARGETFNDENENPFITQISRDGEQDDDSMDLDELSQAIPTRSTPAKHGVARETIPLSPSKTKRQFNTIRGNGQYYPLQDFEF